MRTNVLIGNLPVDTTEERLYDWLSETQRPLAFSVEPNDSGVFRGFATVELSTKEDADYLIGEYDRTEFEGRRVFLHLEPAKSEPVLTVMDRVFRFFGFELPKRQFTK